MLGMETIMMTFHKTAVLPTHFLFLVPLENMCVLFYPFCTLIPLHKCLLLPVVPNSSFPLSSRLELSSLCVAISDGTASVNPFFPVLIF